MGDTSENKPKKHICTGLFAHVDAGKTTLSEAMLYTSGSIRRLGRVDKGDAFLDTYELEKKRGITIFSKQALLKWEDMSVTLLDTPGHVDFSAEMERTLQVLDYAILVISGTEGVQGHTETLWRLLKRYRIPTFLFVNKMDLAGERERTVMADLKSRLGDGFANFMKMGKESFFEEAAVCTEEALETFLETGRIPNDLMARMIGNRQMFPCFFGSALRLQGVENFMNGFRDYTLPPVYKLDFGARVYKITRDGQGNRLTHMKITGGCLKTRDMIGDEKVNQIRIYSGEKFETVGEAEAGCVCAVSGLTKTHPGQGIGVEELSKAPLLEPVITCRIELPVGVDATAMLPKLIQLEEEEPELHITWDEEKKEIHARIMGEIQIEILKNLIKERFDTEVHFGGRSIVYKETIENTVEGVGHFEPLRHYSEVHLLLEPGEPGSGLVFGSACSEDILERNWQRLILTHLAERVHKGILTGSAITDMKITLMSGQAHKKHTEGGDFREAVYRAVRQGLMQAESVLLEPYYDFILEVPEKLVGRAMADVERMQGRFGAPSIEAGKGVLSGSAPVACMDGYQKEVMAYTGGIGHLSCVLGGYGPCHNPDEVIAQMAYDPEGDINNPSSSVFCAHGAGFLVNWDEVNEHMHLESCLLQKKWGNNGFPEAGSEGTIRRREAEAETWIGTEEVDAILKKTFYANSRSNSASLKRGWKKGGKPLLRDALSTSPPQVRSFHREAPKEEYLLVDGYNIIFAWDELKELAGVNLDSARGKLLDILCNYQGMKKCNLIAVFDAYRVQGHATEFLDYHNIHVVYTMEAETADQYIERFAHENGKKYQVTVATSDHLEQIIIRGQNCRLLSARDLAEEIKRVSEELRQELEAPILGSRRFLKEMISDEILQRVKQLEEGN